MLGELVDGEIVYSAVNACIQFLPMIDGKEIVTVEDIAKTSAAPHSSSDCHGISQCNSVRVLHTWICDVLGSGGATGGKQT